MSRESIIQRLEILSGCGLNLQPQFTVDDLIGYWGLNAFDNPGYRHVLLSLGCESGGPPWIPFSENVWHLDTECIYNKGDYAKIARRMMHIAQGSLPLENIQDHLDVGTKSAWVSFECRGQQIRFECKVDKDWVDPSLFSRFVKLLMWSDPRKILLYHDLGGQSCILACVQQIQLARIRSVLPDFRPLT